MSKELPLGGTCVADPYPYPTTDADMWLQLLSHTFQHDRYLYGILLYLRGVGALLIPSGNKEMPYKIVPIIDEDRGWSCMAEWNKEKQWLVPYTKTLIEGIKTL